MAASPIRSTLESAADAMKGLSPGLVRQVLPVLEQLAPIYLDVSQGRQEFSPSPQETSAMVRSYYSVPRNLLLRFKDDSIDDTPNLVPLLQSCPALTSSLDMAVRTLPGDHLRPLQQNAVDLPPPVAKLANQAVTTGGSLIGQLAGVASQFGVSQASAPLQDLSKSVTGMASMFGGEVGGPLTDNVNILAAEVSSWVVANKSRTAGAGRIKALPATLP